MQIKDIYHVHLVSSFRLCLFIKIPILNTNFIPFLVLITINHMQIKNIFNLDTVQLKHMMLGCFYIYFLCFFDIVYVGVSLISIQIIEVRARERGRQAHIWCTCIMYIYLHQATQKPGAFTIIIITNTPFFK